MNKLQSKRLKNAHTPPQEEASSHLVNHPPIQNTRIFLSDHSKSSHTNTNAYQNHFGFANGQYHVPEAKNDKLLQVSCDVPERFFMNCLLKHTAIALIMIVPLIAYAAYAHADTFVVSSHAQIEDHLQLLQHIHIQCHF